MSAEIPPPFALYRMISGFYVSQAIYAIVRLGIADCLSDGPLDTEELARRSKSHVQSLKRVLRLLVTVDLFTEDNQGRFALTPIETSCAQARLDRCEPLRCCSAASRSGPGVICYSVETGELPSAGSSAKTILTSHNTRRGRQLDAAMGGFTAQIAAAVVAAYDFLEFAT
jgi:hypothetical protein